MKKFFFLLLIVAILTGSVWYLYEKYINEFSTLQKDVVEIVLAENIFSYSPYTLVESNNQRLRLIYEPLVKMDDDLSIVPALANSFGRVDDHTWEFTINPNILFHDGTPLTIETVHSNFKRFQNIPELKGLTSSIEEIIPISDLTLQIKTFYPDPSFLNKLASLYIVPPIPLEELELNPIGTGPYKVARIQPNKLALSKNEMYYGRQPVHEKLVLTSISDQFERNRYTANTDRVAMVYPVATSFSNQLTSQKFNLIPFPTTSVNFFLFNFNRPKFRNAEIRRFFTTIISDDFIIESTDKLGKPTNQFISQGVFGYNPDISVNKIDFSNLRSALLARNLGGFQFNIAIPIGLENFKTIFERKLRDSGLLVTIDTIPTSEILSDATMQKYDLIFMGWKSDYGDGSAFFENLVLTDAGLNMVNYSNRQVDALVKSSQTQTTDELRQADLRKAMEIISIQDPIGIPLFENETIYAIDKKYQYSPRIDGFIEPNNLRLKNL